MYLLAKKKKSATEDKAQTCHQIAERDVTQPAHAVNVVHLELRDARPSRGEGRQLAVDESPQLVIGCDARHKHFCGVVQATFVIVHRSCLAESLANVAVLCNTVWNFYRTLDTFGYSLLPLLNRLYFVAIW